MSKVAVIYKSHYGTTRRYAKWISEELGAELFEEPGVRPEQLMEYDIIVYGGGLYAGGVAGSKLVAKNPCKSLVVFTVGLANPELTDFSEILSKNFTPEQQEQIKVFHLRGGIDYGKLSTVHRVMMAAMKKLTEKAPVAERTDDDHLLLETYGTKIDFTDKESITALVEYVRSM